MYLYTLRYVRCRLCLGFECGRNISCLRPSRHRRGRPCPSPGIPAKREWNPSRPVTFTVASQNDARLTCLPGRDLWVENPSPDVCPGQRILATAFSRTVVGSDYNHPAEAAAENLPWCCEAWCCVRNRPKIDCACTVSALRPV